MWKISRRVVGTYFERTVLGFALSILKIVFDAATPEKVIEYLVPLLTMQFLGYGQLQAAS